MKTVLLFALTLCFGMAAMGQTNDTDWKHYKWKGKKTTFQSGYFILKSGKKMEGKMALKGSPGHVDEFMLDNKGKTVSIPAGSVKSFGLYGYANSNPDMQDANVAAPVPECPYEFFEWKSGNVITNGDTTKSTKPRNGYVVLRNGSRVTGDLKLIKHNGVLSEWSVKTANGKKKYGVGEVESYGLQLTINELTKDGTKVFDDQGKNFTRGKVVMTDGSEKEGYVGFLQAKRVNSSQPKMGKYYTGLLIADSPAEYLVTLPEKEVSKVMQTVMGNEVEYVPYENGFVDKAMFGNLEFKDPTRMFQSGSITLRDGTTKTGSVSQVKGSMSWYSTKILFTDANHETTQYSSIEVESFTQTLGIKEVRFQEKQGVFVELMHQGSHFILYRNPFPTTANKFLTGLSRAAVDVGGSIGQGAMTYKMAENNDPNASKADLMDRTAEVQGKVKGMSNEQLATFIDEIEAAQAQIDKNSPYGRYLNQAHAIAGAELIVRASKASIEVKKKEWVFENLQSREKTIVTRGDYTDQVEPLLGSCPDFILMSKKEQKAINSFDEIEKAVAFIDKCYGE